jgi:hypothetical protein
MAGTPSLGTAGCFSSFHWRYRSSLARLDLRRDGYPLHHRSARATRIDPALYLARCHHLKFTSAITGFTLPPLPLLKSHENSPRRGRFSASGDTLMDSLRDLVLIMSNEKSPVPLPDIERSQVSLSTDGVIRSADGTKRQIPLRLWTETITLDLWTRNAGR